MSDYADLPAGIASLEAAYSKLLEASAYLLEGGGAQPIIGHAASMCGALQDAVSSLNCWLKDAHIDGKA
jgi:hypothetical protein